VCDNEIVQVDPLGRIPQKTLYVGCDAGGYWFVHPIKI